MVNNKKIRYQRKDKVNAGDSEESDFDKNGKKIEKSEKFGRVRSEIRLKMGRKLKKVKIRIRVRSEIRLKIGREMKEKKIRI